MAIAIIIENGVLQSVISDGAEVGATVIKIDYDIDKTDDDVDDILFIAQPDGSRRRAYIGQVTIEQSEGPIPEPLS